MQIQTAQKYFAIIRDTVSLGLGSFEIVYQTLTHGRDLGPYMVALALLGVPGAVGAIALFRGSAVPQPTPELPQPYPPQPSQAE